MSAEDEKSRSSWRKEKQRCQQPTRRRVVGVVAANELHPPERQLAVPPPIQQEVRGDFDGDFDLLVWVMKLLHQYLGECREQRRQEAGASLKLQKSHTEAVDDDGRYRHGRARQIVAAKLPVLADYTVMLRRFLAHPCRDELGEALLWPLCEGLEPGLADRMFGLLAPEQGTDDGDKRAAAAQERIERVRGELARGRDQARAGQARRM